MNNNLHIPVEEWSTRPNYSPSEGGVLNAGYTPIDALARIVNLLGQHGLVYDRDFGWERFEYSTEDGFKQQIELTFHSQDAMLTAKLAIESVKNF
jgi:hypothetical protein